MSSRDNFVSQDAAERKGSLCFGVVVQKIFDLAFTASHWTALVMEQSPLRWHRIISDRLSMHVPLSIATLMKARSKYSQRSYRKVSFRNCSIMSFVRVFGL